MNNIRHMPVVENEVLVGVLSLRDLIKSLTQEGTSRARDVLIEGVPIFVILVGACVLAS